MHHIKPKRDGGRDRRDNLITLCLGCHRLWNQLENASPALDFRDYLTGVTGLTEGYRFSDVLEEVYLGRVQGLRYWQIAIILNRRLIRTPRGQGWTATNLAKWSRRHASSASERKNWKCLGWPLFLEPLGPTIWRWRWLDQPFGLVHFRRNRYECFGFDFQITKSKDLLKCRPKHSTQSEGITMVSSRGSMRLGSYFFDPNLTTQPERIVVRYKNIVRPARHIEFGVYQVDGPGLWFPSGTLPKGACRRLTPGEIQDLLLGYHLS